VTHRLMYIGIVGVLLAAFGLGAMLYPVHLNEFDIYGIKVGCGNGFHSDLGQAAETHGRDFVTKCGNAVVIRRVWAIPTVALGWLLITAFLVKWVHNEQQARENAEPAHYVPHPEIARHF
jgi:uncharacterized membrane-anchored protein YitT (DUF2179 family)